MPVLQRERYIHVTDDWSPCYPGHQVKLILGLYYYKRFYIKLMAWGMDDTAFEKVVYVDNIQDLYDTFYYLEAQFNFIPDNIDKNWFLINGFRRF